MKISTLATGHGTMPGGTVLMDHADSSTILEIEAPETANPAKGGAAYRPRPGNWIDVTVTSLPEPQTPVKRKPLFSLMGVFVPISGPTGGLLKPEGKTHAYVCPCPAQLWSA
ncbi:MAG: hypothetical protein JSS43_15370 [Proteobacteria bacterium]|nr:hypothetical protein [Pseudomonadota bacterium]